MRARHTTGERVNRTGPTATIGLEPETDGRPYIVTRCIAHQEQRLLLYALNGAQAGRIANAIMANA